MRNFSQSEIENLLPNWIYKDVFLEKEFVFNDFKTAMVFMFKVAFYAEQINHHPNWTNIYNKVEIKLSTHSVSAITEKDIELAKIIDSIASEF